MQTLKELAGCFQLYAVCERCQRVAPLDLAALIQSEGDAYPVDRLRMRLKCTACDQRSQAMRIVYVGPEGRAATFRYARG